MEKDGEVRTWYETLKIGNQTVVDRMFITGVAPITLDSLTSGFNIASNITLDERFNEMMGFTEEELIQIMDSQEITKENQEYILPIMKENYNGYKFSRNDDAVKIYNSTMCLYFLDYYVSLKKLPYDLTDINIESDYTKVSNILGLCTDAERLNIIKQSLVDEYVATHLVQKFDPKKPSFDINDMFSMLFYMGYLTIKERESDLDILKIPNKIMKKWYEDYYSNEVNNELGNELKNNNMQINREISEKGSIEKVTELAHKYLNNLSNRDYIGFSEKYIKIIYCMILSNLTTYNIISELEINRRYLDLLITPKINVENQYSILIEFKYLKKSDENLLEETKAKAKEQILEYSNLEKIKNIQNLKKYTVVAVVDKLYVDEI